VVNRKEDRRVVVRGRIERVGRLYIGWWAAKPLASVFTCMISPI